MILMRNLTLKTINYINFIAFFVNAMNLFFVIPVLFKLHYILNFKLFKILFDHENIIETFIFIAFLTFSSRLLIWHKLIVNKAIVYIFGTINKVNNVLNIILVFNCLGEELSKPWSFG